LIEQSDLDRNAAALERRAKARWGKRGILRLRPQVEPERGVRRMNIERRERTRVLQNDARSACEVEHGTSEARQLIGARANDPVAIQPEMCMDDASVLEMNQLMLAASFHAADASAPQRVQRRTRYPTLQRWVKNLHSLDDCALNRSAKITNGSLDLWKLRHAQLASVSGVVDSGRSMR
jgi:hypothetical protein